MAKIPLCPKHKSQLSLSEKTLEFAGFSHSVCVGTCPKCSAKYISQQLMSCSTISIEGQKYEYLASLPKASKSSSHHLVISSTAKEKTAQQMDDIEQYFLNAEKDIVQQETIDSLTAENKALRAQLESVSAQFARAEKKHQEEVDALRSEMKTKSEQAVRAFEKKHKEAVEKAVEEYKARIDRLNALHQRNIAEIQQSSKAELEAERRRTTALQQANASLTKQYEALSKQVQNSKTPTKQIVFVNEKLYVCGGTIRCEKFNHRREDVTAIIDTVRGTPVTMTVCHCKDCNLYYVRDMVFESYRDKYGALLGKFVRQADGMKLGQMSTYGELAPESLLHMNGYNVNQTVNLSPSERRKILMYVIESRIMDKHDIRNHLSYLVKMNQSNRSKDVAVSRWLSDIQWVNDYRSGMQDTVWLSGTAMYKYWRK